MLHIYPRTKFLPKAKIHLRSLNFTTHPSQSEKKPHVADNIAGELSRLSEIGWRKSARLNSTAIPSIQVWIIRTDLVEDRFHSVLNKTQSIKLQLMYIRINNVQYTILWNRIPTWHAPAKVWARSTAAAVALTPKLPAPFCSPLTMCPSSFRNSLTGMYTKS